MIEKARIIEKLHQSCLKIVDSEQVRVCRNRLIYYILILIFALLI